MNSRSWVFLSCLGCLLAVSTANAEPDPAPRRPVQRQVVSPAQANAVTKPIYDLEFARTANRSTVETGWRVKNRGQAHSANHAVEPLVPNAVFHSLEAPQLREWVSHLPPGSCIVAVGWLGPMRVGTKGKTLGNSPSDLILADVSKFGHFCQSKNVEFDFLMGGG